MNPAMHALAQAHIAWAKRHRPWQIPVDHDGWCHTCRRWRDTRQHPDCPRCRP